MNRELVASVHLFVALAMREIHYPANDWANILAPQLGLSTVTAGLPNPLPTPSYECLLFLWRNPTLLAGMYWALLQRHINHINSEQILTYIIDSEKLYEYYPDR